MTDVAQHDGAGSDVTGAPVAATDVAATDVAAPDALESIERAVQAVRDTDDTSLAEHASRYHALHTSLQDALSDTDLRDSG